MTVSHISQRAHRSSVWISRENHKQQSSLRDTSLVSTMRKTVVCVESFEWRRDYGFSVGLQTQFSFFLQWLRAFAQVAEGISCPAVPELSSRSVLLKRTSVFQRVIYRSLCPPEKEGTSPQWGPEQSSYLLSEVKQSQKSHPETVPLLVLTTPSKMDKLSKNLDA